MSRWNDEFDREVHQQIQDLANGLVALERDPSGLGRVDHLFRVAHTLKGNCSMAGFDEGAQLAHAVEDVLSAVKTGEAEATADLVDATLDAVDDIETVVTRNGGSDIDADARTATLRETLRTTQGGSADATTSVEAGDETSDEAVDLPDDDGDGLSAREALERASVFDDLDGLAAEMDDNEFEMGGSGSFADIPELADVAGEWPDDLVAPEESPSPSAEFDQVRAEVESESADLDDLQRDLDEVEFGEFDEDDDMTIQELIDIDPTEEEADDTPPVVGDDDRSTAVEAESSADDVPEVDVGGFEMFEETVETPDVKALEADLAEADLGSVDDDDLSIDELLALEPDDGADEMSSGDAQASDETDAAEVEAADEESVADPEGVTAPEDATTSTDAAASEAETADATNEPSVEAPATSATDDLGDGDVESPEAVDASDPFAPGVDEFDVDVDADLPDVDALAAGVGEAPTDADDGQRDDDQVSSGDAQANDETDPTEVEAADAQSANARSELELGIDRPAMLRPRFSRDTGTAAFESRFGTRVRRFEAGVPGVGGREENAVGTLEESGIDIGRFDRTDELTSSDGDESETGPAVDSLTVDVENADTLLHLVEELSIAGLRLEDEFGADLTAGAEAALSDLQAVTSELRQTVMDVRMMPLSTAVEGLPRVARDAARRSEKEVSLVADDIDVTLDRSIIDRIGSPLMHLVRNAVDHGIEPPEAREVAGKPREGSVEIRAERVRDRVVVEVSDDGRGIDTERVRETAVEEGLVTAEEAPEMSTEEVYDLLFEPSFSTAPEVTEVSGRGVGMDVVNRTLAELDGRVEVVSSLGEGTTVRLHLPTSVAVTTVLVTESGREQFAIPLSLVDQVDEAGAMETVDGTERLRDSLLGFDDEDGAGRELVRLRETFETDGDDGRGVVVITRSERRPLAIHCDAIIGTREVVVKPYDGVLKHVPGLSGASLLGDDSIAHIIDPETI